MTEDGAQQVALVTGADRGLGLALVAGLAEQGWQVFAGQFMAAWPELGEVAQRYPEQVIPVPLDLTCLASVTAAAETVRERAGRVDLLISNAGINSPNRTRPIRTGLDYDSMHHVYDTNSLGPLRVVEAFVSLMDASPLKRLCFVSSEAGSIARARRDAWYCYCMSKAALNMGARILFNDLREEGFTFRVYHPGGIRSFIGGSGVRGEGGQEPEAAAVPALAYFLGDLEDEDTLVMGDWRGETWPW